MNNADIAAPEPTPTPQDRITLKGGLVTPITDLPPICAVYEYAYERTDAPNLPQRSFAIAAPYVPWTAEDLAPEAVSTADLIRWGRSMSGGSVSEMVDSSTGTADR